MEIDHVGVLVPDLATATAFARDVLGLGEPVAEFEAPEHGLAGAFFAMGAAKLELFTLEGASEERLPPGAPARVDHVAVSVESIDAERERLGAQGVRFTDPGGTPVETAIELRGKRHLWTDPSTSGGYMLQLIEG